MPDFQIVEAKPYHTGQMARLLRLEHQRAVAMIGLNSHRELRQKFDESTFRKAWLIDGRLAALGGVTGSALSSFGLVWLAFSDAATKYPMAIIREARQQIDEIMQTKRLLVTSVLDGDEAAVRFAIFLGFVPAGDDLVLPASSRFGRLDIARQLKEADQARIPVGTGYARMMAYRQIEAH